MKNRGFDIIIIDTNRLFACERYCKRSFHKDNYSEDKFRILNPSDVTLRAVLLRHYKNELTEAVQRQINSFLAK